MSEKQNVSLYSSLNLTFSKANFVAQDRVSFVANFKLKAMAYDHVGISHQHLLGRIGQLMVRSFDVDMHVTALGERLQWFHTIVEVLVN